MSQVIERSRWQETSMFPTTMVHVIVSALTDVPGSRQSDALIQLRSCWKHIPLEGQRFLHCRHCVTALHRWTEDKGHTALVGCRPF